MYKTISKLKVTQCFLCEIMKLLPAKLSFSELTLSTKYYLFRFYQAALHLLQKHTNKNESFLPLFLGLINLMFFHTNKNLNTVVMMLSYAVQRISSVTKVIHNILLL